MKKRKSKAHRILDASLIMVESRLQSVLEQEMAPLIRSCPKKFQRAILSEYRDYMHRSIQNSITYVLDKTELFMTAKDEAEATIRIFNTRFGPTILSKNKSNKSTT